MADVITAVPHPHYPVPVWPAATCPVGSCPWQTMHVHPWHAPHLLSRLVLSSYPSFHPPPPPDYPTLSPAHSCWKFHETPVGASCHSDQTWRPYLPSTSSSSTGHQVELSVLSTTTSEEVSVSFHKESPVACSVQGKEDSPCTQWPPTNKSPVRKTVSDRIFF